MLYWQQRSSRWGLPFSGRSEAVRPAQRLGFAAGGRMQAWEGKGTRLPRGFAVLRLENNWLHCGAEERVPRAEAEAKCLSDSVQLLCRALRLAPRCYLRFELRAEHPEQSLKLRSTLDLSCAGNKQTHTGIAIFKSVVELAAAMQRFASVEELDVCLALDGQTIVAHRVGH